MIDMTAFFARAGETLKLGLQGNIRRQTDINEVPFSPIARSTAMARQREKGLGRGLSVRLQTKATKNDTRTRRGKLVSSLHVNLHRLMNTNRFVTNAFGFKPGPQSVEISVSTDRYDQNVSYWDIVRYNNQGSPDVNKHIARPPLVWPNTERDVSAMRAMNKVKADYESPRTHEELAGKIFGTVPQNAYHKVTLNV